MPRDPEFVTIDFDEAWEAAVKVAFPGATIIICTFHSAQLLTRGLLKEFNRLQRANNTAFIKECAAARKWSAGRDKGCKESPPSLADPFCRRWASTYNQILKLMPGRDATKFIARYRALLHAVSRWDRGVSNKFEALLAPHYPRGDFTQKGLTRFKAEMRKKWRTILRDTRQRREEVRRKFADIKYLLLKRPENMSSWERKQLRAYLRSNAWAKVPREALLQFYSLLTDPTGKDTSLDFLDALVGPESHDWLRSAVATLKAKSDYVFNFAKAWQVHPRWQDVRAFKVNPEHVMKRVNAVARAQYSFRSDASARFRLERILKCPVIISETVLSEGTDDQVIG